MQSQTMPFVCWVSCDYWCEFSCCGSVLAINFLCSLGSSSKTQNERGRMDQSPKRIRLRKVIKKWRIVMIFVLPIAQEALNHSTLPLLQLYWCFQLDWQLFLDWRLSELNWRLVVESQVSRELSQIGRAHV